MLSPYRSVLDWERELAGEIIMKGWWSTTTVGKRRKVMISDVENFTEKEKGDMKWDEMKWNEMPLEYIICS